MRLPIVIRPALRADLAGLPVRSRSRSYRAELMSNNVKYYNAFATFLNPNTVEAVDKKGKKTTITADAFVVAVGGRPKYPEFPGAREHCITSDDIFSLKTPPGKTLVVGASYVALECAGFIHGVGRTLARALARTQPHPQPNPSPQPQPQPQP